ncbi:MAG: YSIRK-type signal peptide-containing protein [Lactobacillus sp.]|nr:YSIRK-type signal peptide-containing protein [Lactobacillus sp.]
MKNFRDNKQVFSLRKLSVGLCSVVLATISMGGVTSHTVKADDQAQSSQVTSTQSNEQNVESDSATTEKSSEQSVDQAATSQNTDIQNDATNTTATEEAKTDSAATVDNNAIATDQAKKVATKTANVTKTLAEVSSEPTNKLTDGALSLDKSRVSFNDNKLTITVSLNAKQGDVYTITIPKGKLFSWIDQTNNESQYFDMNTTSDTDNIYVKMTAKQNSMVGPITITTKAIDDPRWIMSAKDSKVTDTNVTLSGVDQNGASLGEVQKSLTYDTTMNVDSKLADFTKLIDESLTITGNDIYAGYSQDRGVSSTASSDYRSLSGHADADYYQYWRLGKYRWEIDVPDGYVIDSLKNGEYDQQNNKIIADKLPNLTITGHYSSSLPTGTIVQWKGLKLTITDPNTGETIYEHQSDRVLATDTIKELPQTQYNFRQVSSTDVSLTSQGLYELNIKYPKGNVIEFDIPQNLYITSWNSDLGVYPQANYEYYNDGLDKHIKKVTLTYDPKRISYSYTIYAYALTSTGTETSIKVTSKDNDQVVDSQDFKINIAAAGQFSAGLDEFSNLSGYRVIDGNPYVTIGDTFGINYNGKTIGSIPPFLQNSRIKKDLYIAIPKGIVITSSRDIFENNLVDIKQVNVDNVDYTLYHYSVERSLSSSYSYGSLVSFTVNSDVNLGQNKIYAFSQITVLDNKDYISINKAAKNSAFASKFGLDTDKEYVIPSYDNILTVGSLKNLTSSVNTKTNTTNPETSDAIASVLNPNNTVTTEIKMHSFSDNPTNNVQMVINLPDGIGYKLVSQQLSDTNTTALYSTEYYDTSSNQNGKVDASKFKTWDEIADKSTIKSVLLQSPQIAANLSSGVLTLTATVDNSVSAIGNKGTFSSFITADEYKDVVSSSLETSGSISIANDAKPVITANGDLSGDTLQGLVPGDSTLSNPTISSSDTLNPGENTIKVNIVTPSGTVSGVPVTVLNIASKNESDMPVVYVGGDVTYSDLIDDAVKKAVNVTVTPGTLDLSTSGKKTGTVIVSGTYKGIGFTKQVNVTINVTAPTINIAYYDYKTNELISKGKTFEGALNAYQQIQDSDYVIPAGYTYVSGKFIGAKQYSENSDNSDNNLIKVLVVKSDETLTDEQGNPVTDTKTITRKISSNKEGHNNVTQTITLTGIKHKINTVTGGKVSSTEYTDWLEAKDKWKVVLDSDESATELTSTTLPSFSAEEIAGYTPDKKTIAALDLSTKTNGELDGLNTINEVITYTANPQSVKVVYENLADDTVVGTEDAVSGVTDGTATLTYDKLPAGYTIVSGNVPSYTFTADSDQKVHVKVVKDDETLTDKEGNPVTDTKTVTRKIILKKGASDYKTVTQTITLTGIKHKINTVADGKVSSTEYTDWLEAKDKWTGSLPEYVSEAIAGYTVDKKSVAAIDVTKMTNEDIDKLADSSEVITYTANPQSVQVEYKNIRDNQVVGTEDVINGVTDGTATPTYDKLPAGYTIVSGKVDSYTFTADNDQKIVVSVVPTDETVTDEQGNPVVDNKTVTRKIVLKKGKSHYKTITQTVELKGIKHKTNSVVDGQVTSVDYTDWLASKDQWTGSLPEYKVPKIKGYKADKSKVEAEDLTQKSNTDLTNLADSEVVITYTKTKKPDSGKGGSTKPNDGKKPGSGNKPGDGKKPGSGTKPGDGKKPGSSITPGTTTPGSTKPGDGKKPGSGTTTPGSTKPGDGKKPSSGTKPSDSKKPNKPTKPSDIDTTLKGAIEDAKKKQEHGSSDKDKLKQAINDAEDALKHGSKSDKKKALDNLTDLGLKSAIKSAKDTKNSINAKNISASDKDGLRKAIRDAENALKHGSRAEKNKAMNDLLSAALRLALKNAKALKNSDLYKNASSAQKARLDQAIANAEKALENGSLADKQNALDDLNGAVKDLGKQSGQNDLLKHAPLYALGAAIVAGLGWWFFLLFKRRKRDEEEENK